MAGLCRCFRSSREKSSTSVAPTGEGDMEQTPSAGSANGHGSKKLSMGKGQPGAHGRPFPKRPMGCKLSQTCWNKLEELFSKMDPDGSNAVTKDEARLFFKGAFGKMSADAMFNEVDVDGSGAIDADEFVSFWVHVRKNGYKEQDMIDEIGELLEGGAWVDWKDGRDTGREQHLSFPKRPLLCRLTAPTWSKCRELFEKMDHDRAGIITHEKANKHFKGSFCKVSTEAMFNEIDVNHHGQITPKQWMNFWQQVKSSGYKQQDILDELDNLLQGEQWVDWKDGRCTASGAA